MLHDVLMALAGLPGDVITEYNGNVQGFKVSEECDRVSQSEREVLNSVCAIGYKYRYVERFVRAVRQSEDDYIVSSLIGFDGIPKNRETVTSARHDLTGPSGDEATTVYRGHYLGAMCNGIEEYLCSYKANLTHIEKVILADPALPFSTLSLLMAEQKQVIEGLVYIIECYKDVCRRNRSDLKHVAVRVDEILYMLQRDNGNQTVNQIKRKLYEKCLRLFKIHLRNWLCRGQILDMYQEFIVCRRKTDPDMPQLGKGVDASSICAFEILDNGINPETAEFEWNFSFYIITKERRWMLYSTNLWKKILFLGKAVRMLIRQYNNESVITKAAECIFDSFPEVCSSLSTFEAAIEQFRQWVEQAFWAYINESVDIKAQIAIFRKVYLLGCHEVYTELLERSWFTMQTPCNTASCTNLRLNLWNSILHKLSDVTVEQAPKTGANITSQTMSMNTGTTVDTDYNMTPMDTDYVHQNTAYISNNSGIWSNTGSITNPEIQRVMGNFKPQGDASESRPVFNLRPRSYYFNMLKNRFILSGDVSWIYNEIALNVSKKRLVEPISSASGTSSVWFEEMVHVVHGFETGVKFELMQIEPCHVNKVDAGPTLPRYCRIALVLQSMMEPVRLKLASMVQGTVELLKDCLSAEFVIDYDNAVPGISAVGYLMLGGRCISAFSRVKSVSTLSGPMLCINQSSTKFQITDGSRKDFFFVVKMKVTKKKIVVELQHTNTGESLVMETEVLDTTQLLPHDFGDAYLGIISSPSSMTNPRAESNINKRNCALRISQWDFGATMAKYDIIPNGQEEDIPLCESFRKELPNLHSMEFECGLNDWIHLTMATKSSWPVSIMLEMNTMMAYNSLFQFIFLLRRCVYGLENTTHLNGLMRRFGSEDRKSSIPVICKRAACARWRMYIFMASVLSYLQQCVIEWNYNQLEDNIRDCYNYTEIKAEHDSYIERVATNCFLDEDNVLQPLIRCADIAMKFATLYYCAFNGASEVNYEGVVRRIEEYIKGFEKNMAIVNQRLLLLSNNTKYPSLNTFIELHVFSQEMKP
ncbi:Spc97 / Spc98 family protein [Babesia bovis T2Bo]|uniref:Spc97 / Spc98 family protein n=1 Tax=Babesia bovis T2Bo TaxID=484906 RepID=UPI001C3475D0|nr:Spc97 / Spc98 family protein [Babesia bovis T2Bo]EDO06651.2 Spc97 / Spc98 family protein [Babesia bovis T2Bo]